MSIALNNSNAGVITLTTENVVGTPYSLAFPLAYGTSTNFMATDGAGNVAWVAPTALAYGTAALGTTAPNTVNFVGSLTLTSAPIVHVFQPKGSGANIWSNHPNNGTLYGNARGAYATEINMVGTWDLDTDVASGTGSVAVGTSSMAAGAYSVAFGTKSRTSSDYSVAIGRGYLGSNAQYSVAIGRGSYTTTPTTYGTNNQYSVSLTTDTPSGGNYQAHLGGSGNALKTGVYGACIFPNWVFGPYTSNVGTDVAKRFAYNGALRTVNATPANVYADSSSATGNGYFKLEARSISAVVDIVVVAAVTTTGGDCKAWRMQNGAAVPTATGVYQTDATTTVTTITAITLGNTYASAGAASWAASVAVDNTNRALTVTVTGQAATTIQWYVWMCVDSLTYA
jgi:hypothetical protein